ncbi:peptidase domain-containing ABC transporter [Rudaea sp. 3F27F6]|uniref:peptidase domain-containing ABC transporter n=1 Tax=Rudaea sp. 3F27F6 TaxID=2502208 RepID=UPI0010F608BC|nr:peptidase domain-containing ABC transporter [Rudaea sp. 3F27F6]
MMRFFKRRRVPLLWQTEVAECGIACLAMIAEYHGSPLTLDAMRVRYPQSLQGVTLAHLMQIAGEIGFVTRPVQADLTALPRLKTPCILHWDLSHFVVLARATRRFVEIHDPAGGTSRLSYAEASRHFTGIALEIEPADTFERCRRESRVSLGALTGSIVGLKRALFNILALALGLEAVTLLAPIATQILLDQVLPTDDRRLLLAVSLGFGALLVLQACLAALRSWSLIALGADTAFGWSRNMFRHLLNLPAPYFSNRSLGDILSRFDSINTIQHTLTHWSVEALLDGVMACVTAAMLIIYSPVLATIPFVAFALYMAVRIATYGAFRSANLKSIQNAASVQSFLVESVRGVQTIKLQNATESRASNFSNVTFQSVQSKVHVERLTVLFTGASTLIAGFQRLGVLSFGIAMVLDRELTVGALMVFLLYSGQFSDRGAKMLDYFIELRMLRLQTERLADVALNAPEDDAPNPAVVVPQTPSIEFRDVSFRYDLGGRFVIHGCSFIVHPAEVVAIVGPSGFGKTTLIKLMLGLLEPESGVILIGGVDIREVGKSRLRTIASTVLQDDQVFMGTVEQNVHFFSQDADLDRVVEAATIAEIHHEILALPMGYQTIVGDLGSTLSAGQKQRLLMARALYRRPQVLILDEATSHLDVPNERLVCDALRNVRITRVMVAHRPETIRMADRVLILEKDGTIQAEATPPLQDLSEQHRQDHSYSRDRH